MGQNPTKAAENMYCRCRKGAAMLGGANERLNSREGAAEELGISPSTLASWELDITRPQVDAVVRMADLYGAPELLNYYCCSECPIGRRCVSKVEVKELDRAIIEIVGALGKSSSIREDLLDITADGVVSPEERPRLEHDLKCLEEIAQRAGQLKLCVAKRLGEEA